MYVCNYTKPPVGEDKQIYPSLAPHPPLPLSSSLPVPPSPAVPPPSLSQQLLLSGRQSAQRRLALERFLVRSETREEE